METTEAELRIAYNAMSCGLIMLSPEWQVVRMNPAAETILGWRAVELRGRPFQSLWGAVREDGSPFVANRGGGSLKDTILGMRRRDGNLRWLQVDIVPAFHPDGTPKWMVFSFVDLTERKLAEEALQESEARYRLLFDRNPHPTWVVERETQAFLVVNEAAVHHYGYTREEFLSMTARELHPPEDVAVFVDALTAPAVSRFARRWRHQKKDGTLIYVEVDSHPLLYGGRPPRIAVVTDITERKQAEEALAHQALYDPLTNLPNRALLHDVLRRATRGAERDVTSAALLVMDLDRFKEVNDTFGHHCGDLLLRQVGERLQGALRGPDMLARLGGDEFAVVLPDADRDGAEQVAQRLLCAFEEPFAIDGHDLAIGASIGIALFPDHATDAETLLRRSDVAMYVAKRSGSGHAVYALDQDDNSPSRLALASELRRAIEHDELLLHYQPKLTMRDGTLIGVEALVRWQHPQRGFLPPSEFITLAEQTGLIYPLSRWVLEAALKQHQAWRAVGLDVPVAVNLSRRTLHDPELPDMVAQLLTRWDVAPGALVLEITESSLMADPLRAGENLSQLRAQGVCVSIDDFGTGYSSLASLRNLSVDELKIDQSFVQAVATDISARAIVRAIIDLADALKLRVIAEGVEDQLTWDVLAGLGCGVAQGYFVSRPISAVDLAAWAAQAGPAWQRFAGNFSSGQAA